MPPTCFLGGQSGGGSERKPSGMDTHWLAVGSQAGLHDGTWRKSLGRALADSVSPVCSHCLPISTHQCL